jgi:hypothetical protein
VPRPTAARQNLQRPLAAARAALGAARASARAAAAAGGDSYAPAGGASGPGQAADGEVLSFAASFFARRRGRHGTAGAARAPCAPAVNTWVIHLGDDAAGVGGGCCSDDSGGAASGDHTASLPSPCTGVAEEALASPAVGAGGPAGGASPAGRLLQGEEVADPAAEGRPNEGAGCA